MLRAAEGRLIHRLENAASIFNEGDAQVREQRQLKQTVIMAGIRTFAVSPSSCLVVLLELSRHKCNQEVEASDKHVDRYCVQLRRT